jgi:hypothetical protein
MRLQLENLDLMQYQVSVVEIDTYFDPDDPAEGHMIIRVQGTVGDVVKRIQLIDAAIPHIRNRQSNLLIHSEGMGEIAAALVKPQQQSIPQSGNFILVWESDRPYFTGTNTGAKYVP